jgi:hypothetical protein
MSPQLRSTLTKVLAAHYHGESDPKYVIGALICIAAEPTFATKLAVEAIRLGKKMLCELLEGEGDFLELIRNPKNRAVVQELSLAHSYCLRRSNGKNQEPLLADIGE